MTDLAVLDRIKKLRALATSSNPNEAAAAAGVANKLILKHQITEAQLATEDSSKESKLDNMFDDPEPIYVSQRVSAWKVDLATLLARHYGCALWNDKSVRSDTQARGVSRFRLIGREGDVQIVKFMFSWFVTEIQKLCEASCRGQGLNYRDSYCKGAVKGIESLLTYTRERTIHEAKSSGGSQAIELVQSRHKLAIEYMFKKHNVIQPTGKLPINQQAFEAGFDVGNSVARSAAT